MKAIMISIKPKWCAEIMNSKKTIEVRKNKALAGAIQKLIDENGYAEIYVYCSKDGGNLVANDLFGGKKYWLTKKYKEFAMNGKALFKFRCYKVEDIKYHFGYYDMGEWTESYILENACLTAEQLDNYLKASYEYDENKPSKVYGYAIHISDLEIFDKPKELSEFKRIIGYTDFGGFVKTEYMPLIKAPQNMVYVEV